MRHLTRSQVALRLGRSIATVRRLEREGTLQPAIGRARVRLFDSRDVAALAERSAQSGRTLSLACVCGHRGHTPLTYGGDGPEKVERAQALRARFAESVIEFIDVVRPRNARAVELAEEILDILEDQELDLGFDRCQ